MTAARITDLRFTPASATEAATGLLGFVRCVFADTLVLDGIAVRQTLSGRLTLAFPSRRDRAGNPHPYVRPRDDATRLAIEAEVFATLFAESAS